MEPIDLLQYELNKLLKDVDNAKNRNGVIYLAGAEERIKAKIDKYKKAIEILNKFSI